MRITTVIAIYFLIWWLSLFAVLPFGIRSQHEGDDYAEGTDPGAPIVTQMGAKLLWTTIVATVIFLVLALAYNLGWLKMAGFMGAREVRRNKKRAGREPRSCIVVILFLTLILL